MVERRLIEVAFPLKEVSVEAAREKSIRHGHINTLHIWWARKPLVACRAAVLASLLHSPRNEQEVKKLTSFIVKFCKWERSNDANLVAEARRLVLGNNGGKPPKLLDCFAGGGSIPLEALRVGCDAYSQELNPVAVLLELCTLVYPQKYGKPVRVSSSQTNMEGENKRVIENRLAHDVSRWGKWVLEEARKDLGKLYPLDSQGIPPLAYIWAHTLKCPNPKCGADMPLLQQLWLANKRNKKIALRMIPDSDRKKVRFEIAEGDDIDFDPKKATIRLGTAQCPVCKQGTLDKFAIKKRARENGFGLQPLVVVFSDPVKGRAYRQFSSVDSTAFAEAVREWEKMKHLKEGRLSAIPDENISTDFDWVLKPPMFGLTKWGDIFNARQAVALATFAKKVREAYTHIVDQCHDRDYALAVATYLAIALDRVEGRSSILCIWNSPGEKLEQVFGRQALAMAWGYGEVNPFSGQMGDWTTALEWIRQVIEHCSKIQGEAKVAQGSATHLQYPDGYFDAVVIDPPYYDAVPYSDLSDFFYVWMKRTVGYLYPRLFATPLAPKSDELVYQSDKVTSAAKRIKDKDFYENKLTEALKEVNRILHPNGVCVVVFAHKKTSAWEKLVMSVLAADFQVTASWPLHTEMMTRLRAQSSAALASSVWLVCRKRSKDTGIAAWKNVQAELDKRVKERLEFFLSQGIKGADALLSAIGPALEVFGSYTKVEKVTGEPVKINEFLDKVREVVAYHALSTVLSEQELGKVDPPTAFYVLWKWVYEPAVQTSLDYEEPKETSRKTGNGVKTLVPFDDALKLARSVGVEIETLLKSKLLKQEKEYVRMLGPMDRKDIHSLGNVSRDGTAPTVIDMIHQTLILWASQEHGKLDDYLQTSGAVTNETFWRVAQALSNLLPLQSKEKQLLDGLLARHTGGISQTDKKRENKTLYEFMKGDK